MSSQNLEKIKKLKNVRNDVKKRFDEVSDILYDIFEQYNDAFEIFEIKLEQVIEKNNSTLDEVKKEALNMSKPITDAISSLKEMKEKVENIYDSLEDIQKIVDEINEENLPFRVKNVENDLQDTKDELSSNKITLEEQLRENSQKFEQYIDETKQNIETQISEKEKEIKEIFDSKLNALKKDIEALIENVKEDFLEKIKQNQERIAELNLAKHTHEEEREENEVSESNIKVTNENQRENIAN
ncbi:MAG: hypothetical protein ACTSQE_13110 [Candidatus Heimdallarchaeaceae archaeon]